VERSRFLSSEVEREGELEIIVEFTGRTPIKDIPIDMYHCILQFQYWLRLQGTGHDSNINAFNKTISGGIYSMGGK
jgi:hypothetical protein